MSYLVLARKWRPTTFKELVGQQHVVQTLSNAIATGRVHHAFLFTGCRGVGKTSAARILAKALNCEEGLSVDPCGHCTNCLEIAEGSSPDVYEIDGASNTSVDNIRELRESVRYLPAKSRFKIYIIDEVHMLSTSAFNALLKTLEEPPPHVKFIFATTEPQKIPITILSRCQRFDFRRVSGHEMLGRLREMMTAEQINIDDQALRVIIRESQGSMRDAQSLLEQAIAFCGDDLSEQRVIEAIGAVDRHYVEEALQGIVRKDPGRALDAVNHVYTAGHDLVDFTALLSELLRDLAVVSAGLAVNLLERSESEVAMMKELTNFASAIDIQRFFSFISNTSRELRNAPIPKLVLDMAVLRCCAVEHTHNLGAILNEMRNIYAGAPVKPSLPSNYQFSSCPVQAPVVPPVEAPKALISPPAAPVSAAPRKPVPSIGAVSIKETPLDETKKALPDQPARQVANIKGSEQILSPEDDDNPPLPDDDYAGANYEEAALLADPEPMDVPPAAPTVTTYIPPAPLQNIAEAVQSSPIPSADGNAPNLDQWAAFIAYINNVDMTLGPILEHAYIVQFSANLIQLSFNGNDFYRSFLSERATLEKATSFAKKFFQVDTKIQIVEYTDKYLQLPLCEQATAKEKSRLRELHQQAENDPRVKSAIAILDGSIINIRTL